MADTFGPEIVNLFGASYGREAAANDSINAELESKRANAMAQRGQGLQSMFNVKKGEAMLPFDLATAQAGADPELLQANKSKVLGSATQISIQTKEMLRKVPAKQIEDGVRESMTITKGILSMAVSHLYAGSTVDNAIQSAIKQLPPDVRNKIMEDPATLEQLMQWTKETDPQAATQQFTSAMNGIDQQLEHLDGNMYKDMMLKRMELEDRGLDRQSRERIADKEIAQRSSSSRESSLSTDKYLVQAAQQLFPKNIPAQTKWINEQVAARTPGFAGSTQTQGMTFGPQGVTNTKSVTKTPQATSAPQARPQAPAQSDRVVIKKGGKQFTVPRSQLQDALKQGYTQ